MSDKPPPLFTPAAQWTCAALLALALILAGWQGYGKSPWSARPLSIIPAVAAPIDLNSADVSEIAAVPGLGEVIAARIVAQRESAGAYHSVDDLRKVRGIGATTLERIRPYFTVADEEDRPILVRAARPENTKKPPPEALIDVNRAGLAELQRLPGIGPVLAGRIIEARQKAAFRQVEDLRKVKGIGAKTLDKVRPHIKLK